MPQDVNCLPGFLDKAPDTALAIWTPTYDELAESADGEVLLMVCAVGAREGSAVASAQHHNFAPPNSGASPPQDEAALALAYDYRFAAKIEPQTRYLEALSLMPRAEVHILLSWTPEVVAEVEVEIEASNQMPQVETCQAAC